MGRRTTIWIVSFDKFEEVYWIYQTEGEERALSWKVESCRATHHRTVIPKDRNNVFRTEGEAIANAIQRIDTRKLQLRREIDDMTRAIAAYEKQLEHLRGGS